jgi:RNA polymerase sigma-70 factor (ECF subfamily)
MEPSKSQIKTWIDSAKSGQTESLGFLLSAYTNYLKMLAEEQLDFRLRRRLNASDIVQETLLEAFRDFHLFRGCFADEFRSWLRRILIHNLMHTTEKHLTASKRDIRNELSFAQTSSLSGLSKARIDWLFVDQSNSPSAVVCEQEKRHLVAKAILALPSDYREIIELRHLDGLEFSEIATRLGKSSGACRMLWLRAIERLKNSVSFALNDGER